MHVWYTVFKSGFSDSNIKSLGPTPKKDVWYIIFKWGLKSQLEFYVGPIPNLSSAICLFLNPIWIQIQTEFMWVPVSYRYWAHLFSFLPIFSLSLLHLLLCFSLSCSRPLKPPKFHRENGRKQTEKIERRKCQKPKQKRLINPSFLQWLGGAKPNPICW